MKRRKNSKIMLGLLIAVVALGVGYAAITGVNLLINGSASIKSNGNFSVRFVRPIASETAIDNAQENAITISGYNADESAMNVSEMSASVTDDTHATFAVGALDEVGESVDFTYTVVNESDEGIDAALSLEVADENDLADYFEITKSVGKNKIASNETTTVTVRVKLIGQPKVNDVEGTFKITLTSTPVDNSEETSENNEAVTPLYSISGGAKIGSTIDPSKYENTNETIVGPYMKLSVDSNNQVVGIEGCKTGTANANEVCITAVDTNESSNNKEILASYFGGSMSNIPSECSEADNDGTMEFTCSNSYVVLAADDDGGIWIMDKEHSKQCVINPSFGIYSCS